MAIRYFVSDLAQSLPFYTDILGFEVQEQWGPAFAIVSKDGQDLWLSGPGTSAASVTVDGESPKAGGWSRIVVGVDDLESFAAYLGEEAILSPLISGPGGKQLIIADPDGNHIELFESR